MVGRPMRKVFCQGFTRAGRRIGKLIPCGMKGHELANGTYYCKYHGFQNKLGFNKKNYTDETRIKQLSKLQQFRNYTDEKLREYYYTKVKVRIDNNEPSRYNLRKTNERFNSYRNTRGKTVRVQLDEILSFLKKKSRHEREDN